MKRLFAALLFALVAALPTAAPAWFPHGEPPLATTFPQIGIGAGFSGPTPQPATQGVSTQFGYNDNAIAVWDAVPYALYNTPAPICVIALHNAGIASVTFSVDGGAWTPGVYTTTGPANTPPQAGLTPTGEYCARLTPGALADGQHEIRAIATPNIGVPRVLQSGATASVTAGNPFIPHAAHGQLYGKGVVVSSGASLGFAGAPSVYYIARGSVTPAGYMLTTVASSTSVSFLGGALWSLYQTNAYAAGQPIVLAFSGTRKMGFPSGLAPGGLYYVCANNLTSSSYQVSTTLADALGACSLLVPTGSFNTSAGTYYATPVIAPTASGSIVIDYLNKSGLENAVTMGESLFVNTNANGTAAYGVQYVDATPGGAGVDPSTAAQTACTTSSAPCATIHGALANLAASGGVIANVSNATDGCALFTKPTHKLQVGQGVVLGGAVGLNFTLFPGSISPLSSPGSKPPTGQLYWVAPQDYTSGAFTLTATPNGACIQWAAGDSYGTGGTYHNVTVYPDVGGATIYLMCDAPCVSPTPYAFGAVSEGTTRNTVQTYVNILPAPGRTAANVAIESIGGSSGVRANKVHLAANLTAPVFNLVSLADSPAGTSTFYFAANSLPSALSPLSSGAFFVGGGGCGATGYTASNETYQTAISSTTQLGASGFAELTVSQPNFADCPAGTTLSFAISFALTEGFDIWIDTQTSTGPGLDIYNSLPVGNSAAWTGGIFYTNVTASQYQQGLSNSTFTRNANVFNMGATAFNDTSVLLNSASINVGIDGSRSLTAIAPTTPGAKIIYVAAGTLPVDIQAGWIVGAVSNTACNTGPISITGYFNGNTTAPGWISLAAATPSGCNPGVAFTIGNGAHSDWAFNNVAGNNSIVASSSCLSGCNAEGFMEQGSVFMDQAMVNSSISLYYPLGFQTVLLEGPLTNGYFAGNTLNGLVLFDTAVNFTGTDIVFSNNTCVGSFAGEITTGAAPFSGIHVIGGNC